MNYIGPMDLRKMSPVAEWAYRTWKNQRNRCNNPRATQFKDWGGRGIRVMYSSRDFVSWAINQVKPGDIGNISIGRINHDSNYDFGNIEVVTKSENSREMLLRTNNKPNRARAKRVAAYDGFGSKLAEFDSCGSAARTFHVDGPRVSRICRNINGPMRNGVRFEFVSNG